MNVQSADELDRTFPGLDLILIESGGDNLASSFSLDLVDHWLFVIDVAGGDDIPRKRGLGVLACDLLVINKVDLAPYVGVDLAADAARGRRRCAKGAPPCSPTAPPARGWTTWFVTCAARCCFDDAGRRRALSVVGASPGRGPARSAPRCAGAAAAACGHVRGDGGRRRTHVGAQRATHPFHICRALYRPEDPHGLCTLYVQGCSGGLFEGDRAALTIVAEPEARAHVTTAAATIVHRMPGGGVAAQTVELEAGAGALLEYLPDPLILFSGSRLTTRLRIVRLGAGARAIVGEGFLCHRLPDDERPFDGAGRRDADRRPRRPPARPRALRGHRRGTGLAGGRGRMGGHACLGSLFVLGAGVAPLAPAARGARRPRRGSTAAPPRCPARPASSPACSPPTARRCARASPPPGRRPARRSVPPGRPRPK